jgi:predicted HNH restriction endonuclease
VPLAESGSTATKLADLALVCSNCHRILHWA